MVPENYFPGRLQQETLGERLREGMITVFENLGGVYFFLLTAPLIFICGLDRTTYAADRDAQRRLDSRKGPIITFGPLRIRRDSRVYHGSID